MPNSTVGLFLCDLFEQKASIQWAKEETLQQQHYAENLVQSICKLMGNLDPQFSIHEELIRTGSYYDRTKVGAPDEFDFVCVLDNLSNELKSDNGILFLQEGCQVGYTHVLVNGGEFLYDKCHRHLYLSEASFKQYCRCNTKRSSEWNLHHGITAYYASLVREALAQLQKEGKVRIINDDMLTEDHIPEGQRQEADILYTIGDHDIYLPAPGLRPNDVYVYDMSKGPNIQLIVGSPVSGQRLDIDMTFGLAHPCHEHKPLIVPWSPQAVCKNHVLDPTPLCWALSFSEMEKTLVQNMQPLHRKLHITLKYLVAEMMKRRNTENVLKDYVKGTYLYSHVIKHVMLHHNRDCDSSDRTHSHNLGICMELVLKMFSDIFDERAEATQHVRQSELPELSDFCVPSRNILAKHTSENSFRRHHSWMTTSKMLHVLQKFILLIGQITVEKYNFQMCLQQMDDVFSEMNTG